jgi:hypothetical protein
VFLLNRTEPNFCQVQVRFIKAQFEFGSVQQISVQVRFGSMKQRVSSGSVRFKVYEQVQVQSHDVIT